MVDEMLAVWHRGDVRDDTWRLNAVVVTIAVKEH
jgi:hypothetical protein